MLRCFYDVEEPDKLEPLSLNRRFKRVAEINIEVEGEVRDYRKNFIIFRIDRRLTPNVDACNLIDNVVILRLKIKEVLKGGASDKP